MALAILAIIYGLFVRRLATLVEPWRFHLAELGEKYLEICDNPRERAQIRFYLDNAFNPWIAVAACFLIWIALLLVVVKSHAGFEPKIREEHDRICGLFTLSTLAANPVFGLIAVIEIVAVSITIFLVAGNIAVMRRAIDWMVETQTDRSRHRHAH
jgi:hypothetical protein